MTNEPSQEPRGNAKLVLLITLGIGILSAALMIGSMFWLKGQAEEHGSAPAVPVTRPA